MSVRGNMVGVREGLGGGGGVEYGALVSMEQIKRLFNFIL